MSTLVSTSKVTGFGSRLLNAADRIAPTAGTVTGIIKPFMAKGGGSIEGAVGVIGSTITGFKFANPLSTTMSALRQPAVYPILDGVKSWLGGLIASEIGDQIGGDMGQVLQKGGSAAMKFGTAAASTSLILSYALEQAAGGGPGLLGFASAVDSPLGSNFGTTGRKGRRMLRQDNPEVLGRTQPTSGAVRKTPQISGAPF